MWLNLQIFGFKALWSPYFLLFILALGCLYFLITGPFRHKFGAVDKPTLFQQVMFYLGLILLYALKGAPVDLLSHIMFSAHMLQTALLYFVFPVLIIKGIPKWLWEKLLSKRFVKKIFDFFTKPLIALLFFSSFLALYHMPVVFDFTKSSIPVHALSTIIILLAAFFMWWIVIPPLKEYEILSPVIKMLYLMASAAIITVACALIIFASSPMYLAYSAQGSWIQAMSLCVPADVLTGLSGMISGPEMFSPISTIHDQQFGGAIMMVVQQIVYVITIGLIFYREWFVRDNMSIDPLPMKQSPESH